MAEYRRMLLLLLLLFSISTDNSTSALLNTSTSSMPSLSRDSSPFGNERSLYPLSNNSSYISGPSNISTIAGLALRATETNPNIPISSSLSGLSNSLLEVTTDTSGTVPTTFPTPTSHSFALPLQTLVEEKPDIPGTEPALTLSPASGKFQHTSEPLWPLTNSSHASGEAIFDPPSAISSRFLIPGGTNFSGTAPTKPSFDGSQGNPFTILVLSPATVSGTPKMNLLSPESRNNSSAQPPLMNTSNPSMHNEAYIPLKNSTEEPDHGLVTIPEVLSISTIRSPSANGSVYPPFPKLTTNSVEMPTNLSSTVPTALLLHKSRDNSDLYPSINISRVTINHTCPPRKFIETSTSRTNESGTVSRPLLPRQSHDQSDLYPPVEIACAARDAAFFEFSEENIRNSEVLEWYARWSVEARDKYLEKYTHLGEWRLFYRWWLQEYDFRCGYDFAGCLNAKNREDIQRIYPGEENRNLVRRIYFMTLMYEYLHQHTRMMEDTFKELHEDIAGHISELIGGFTQHGDPHGAHLCEVYKLVVQTTVSAALQLFSTVTNGVAMPYLAPGQTLALGQPTFGPKIGKWEQQISFGLYTWATMGFTGQTLGYWGTWQHLMEDRINREQPILVSGMGRGWSGMCASVEGDFQDNGGLNEKRLTTYLSVTFENIREFNRNTSSDIYMGNFVPQPGHPSLMASIISHRKWAGENSIVSEMEDARPVKRFIRRATMKQVISKLISQSNNWMKCTHDEKAPKMCEDAKAARQLGAKGYGVDRSRFCPNPDIDPTYICQVGGWYFADDHQHEKRMSGLDTLETFWENEFKFTLNEFMGEVYANYETCGNNCTQTDMAKLAFSGDYERVRGFTLPVCRNDHNQVSDFLKRGLKRYHFPSICGDFSSNETEGFMKAVNMGPDSQAAKTRSIEQLWRDRIPRGLEGLRPFNYYIALCRHKIRFPDIWKWTTAQDKLHNLKNAANHFQIPHQHKPCKHCEWVDNSTQGMDEMEANHFFCQSRYVWDNILTQQASHIDMLVHPTQRFENLETKCRKWTKKHGGKIPYKTKAPWLIDIDDAAKLVWNNFWRVFPFTAPMTVSDTVGMMTAKNIELD